MLGAAVPQAAGAGPSPGLNPADCDLCVQLSDNGSQASSVSKDGCGYMFGGVRASLGVLRGRWCFNVKFLGTWPVNVVDTLHLRTSCVARVGVSQLHTPVGRLGEVMPPKHPAGVSVGLNSTGTRVSGGVYTQMSPAWPAFTPGDTLTVFVDLAPGPTARLGYALNGTLLGFLPDALPHPEAQLAQAPGADEAARQRAVALFPHLLLRNAALEVDLVLGPPAKLRGLGVTEPAGPYQAWAKAAGLSTCGTSAPGWPLPAEPCQQCEVLMMVGLPGSGKTTWAVDFSRQHPQQRYLLLSPEQVLDAMRVLALKSSHTRKRLAEQSRTTRHALHPQQLQPPEQQDHSLEQYYGLANATFNLLLKRAAGVPRNYILDQTNVSEAGRVAKLGPFKASGFKLRAALAAPYLAFLTMLQETALSEGAPHLPDDILLNLMAEFVAPQPQGPEGFQEVLLVHRPRSRRRPAVPLPDDPLAAVAEEEEDEQEPLTAKVARVARQVVAPQRQLAQRRLQHGKANDVSSPEAAEAGTSKPLSAGGAQASSAPAGPPGEGDTGSQALGTAAAASKSGGGSAPSSLLTPEEQLIALSHLKNRFQALVQDTLMPGARRPSDAGQAQGAAAAAAAVAASADAGPMQQQPAG